MKKTIMILLTAMLAMVISACSGDKDATIEVKQSAKEMADQMIEKVEQPVLMELSTEELKDLYNIDAAKLADYSVRIPMMNVKSNEIAIFKVKDAKDISDIEAAVKQRAENVQKLFEQYLPDQYENAKNYKLITKGNYVLLVISDSADELIKVYDSFFETK
jgi:Holliday junction resolvase-like predicted endonuclease